MMYCELLLQVRSILQHCRLETWHVCVMPARSFHPQLNRATRSVVVLPEEEAPRQGHPHPSWLPKPEGSSLLQLHDEDDLGMPRST